MLPTAPGGLRGSARIGLPSMFVLYVLLAALALVICVFAAPIGRALGVVDHPDGKRKMHQRETPLVGGLALILPVAVMAVERALSTDLGHFYGVIALTVT